MIEKSELKVSRLCSRPRKWLHWSRLEGSGAEAFKKMKVVEIKSDVSEPNLYNWKNLGMN